MSDAKFGETPTAGKTPEQIAFDNDIKAAEKRLADARAAALASATPRVTGFTGLPNGPFVIEGENLGGVDKRQGVKIDGYSVDLTAVRATSLKGVTPRDVKPGKGKKVEVAGAKVFSEGYVG